MNPSEVLVSSAAGHGATAVFGVPGGGSNLELIAAAETAGLRFVLVHAETAGAIAAATHGLLTGSVGIAIATRGPGTTSLVNGAAQATLDRYPLLLATDCVGDADAARVAHQRIDQHALLRPVTKWSATLAADRGAGATADHAVAVARAAPLGAVHLDIDPSGTSTAPELVSPFPIDELSAAAIDLARRSDHPIVIAGVGALDDPTSLRRTLEAIGAPVLTTYQAAGLLPSGHPLWAGLYTSGAIERAVIERADLVVTVGLDTVEPMPTPWHGTAPVLALDATPPASSFVPATHRFVGPVVDALEGLAPALREHRWPADAGRIERERTHELIRACSTGTFGPVELVEAVVATAPAGVAATVDAGAHFLAVMPFWPVSEPHRLLISNGLATMGFALPAAIGMAVARPGAPVVALVGDGGLAMTLAELETIARLRLPITVVLFDDAALSLIEIKQRPGQGGPTSVRYTDVDYAAVARAMGLDAVRVDGADEVGAALSGSWERPRLVDARIDPSPYRSIISTVRG